MIFGAGAPKDQAVWCSLAAHPKFNDHFLKFASVKGGIISEGIFDLVQSSKKMNQNIVPQLFTFGWKDETVIWFGFFEDWGQIENYFLRLSHL